MIQDIAPKKYDISYKDPDAAAEDYILCYGRDGILLTDGEKPQPPKCALLEGAYEGRAVYLFSIDDTRFFLAPDIERAIPGMSVQPLRSLLSLEPSWLGYAGLTGAQLWRWYRGNRFCGSCGAPMGKSRIERALVCPECGATVYPKICPACIIGPTDSDRILVTKYAANPKARHYALIAGFVETGETFEDCVRREVMEEVGLKVKDIRYYKSQPWSLTDTLLAGFYCHLDGSDSIKMDEGELSVARWISRGELEMDYTSGALTYEMLREFKNGNQG